MTGRYSISMKRSNTGAHGARLAREEPHPVGVKPKTEGFVPPRLRVVEHIRPLAGDGQKSREPNHWLKRFWHVLQREAVCKSEGSPFRPSRPRKLEFKLGGCDRLRVISCRHATW